jgi:hypothetical protein
VDEVEGADLSEIEIRGDDIDGGEPAGLSLANGEDPAALQEYLADEVRRGDSLTFRLLPLADTSKGPNYAVWHHDRIVGRTSQQFGVDLRRIVGPRTVTWPTEMRGIHVDEVDCAAGAPDTGMRCGLGISGLWLRVRGFGLAELTR